MADRIDVGKLPVPAIEDARRGEIISGLNKNLAHLIDLGLSSKQAHWNVHGPNFQGLHELFDTIAAEVREWQDMLAERVLALRGTAHGTLQDAASGTSFAPFPTDRHDWEPLVMEMQQRTMGAANQMRETAKGLEEDLVTQDLYIEIIRGLDMRAWMLEAHLHRLGGNQPRPEA
jgi:starvation-inducible DNA-binding protein